MKETVTSHSRPANVREHIAFIRGVHSCPGAPLARTEGRISLNRILDRMSDIKISEEHRGSPGARSYSYEPTFIIRGLSELHISFTPAESHRWQTYRSLNSSGQPARTAARRRRERSGFGRRT